MILVRVMGNFQLVNEQVYCCKGLCFNQNHELRVAVGPEVEQVIWQSEGWGFSLWLLYSVCQISLEDANPNLLSDVFTGV